MLLCYPALFQTDSPAATSLRNLPKHVWTSTTGIDADRTADVIVRQVWVHGDYMKAVELPVLRKAMHIQDALIGTGFGDNDGIAPISPQALGSDLSGCLAPASTGQKWGYHSPVMYWNCSLEALENDQHLLNTINEKIRLPTAFNLTLRPSTVFAGKIFSGTKLRAADALVITLFDRTDAGLGDTWDSRSRELADQISPEWTVYPPDGQSTKNQLYEFRFRPMTLSDDILLAASYLVTAIYVIWRMMKLRAVKSWFGLLVTISVKVIFVARHNCSLLISGR